MLKFSLLSKSERKMIIESHMIDKKKISLYVNDQTILSLKENSYIYNFAKQVNLTYKNAPFRAGNDGYVSLTT